MRVHLTVILLVFAYFSTGVMSKKVAGLAVFRRINGDIEYLMLKPNSHKKEWSPPKGRLDSGEDPLQAAIRETKEETDYGTDDLNIHADKPFQMNQFTRKRGKNKTVMFWLAELENMGKLPKLDPNEHSEYRWVTKDKAIEICNTPAFVEIINEFDQYAKTLSS